MLGGSRSPTDFKPTGTEYPLAIRLSGQFQDRFPGGKTESRPEAEPAEQKDGSTRRAEPEGIDAAEHRRRSSETPT